MERKRRESARKTGNSAQNAKFRTFSHFRENELKIPIKDTVFIGVFGLARFLRFWSEKAEKCDFAKSAILRENVHNLDKFRLFGPDITFWAPPGPPRRTPPESLLFYSPDSLGWGEEGGGVSSLPFLLWKPLFY